MVERVNFEISNEIRIVRPIKKTLGKRKRKTRTQLNKTCQTTIAINKTKAIRKNKNDNTGKKTIKVMNKHLELTKTSKIQQKTKNAKRIFKKSMPLNKQICKIPTITKRPDILHSYLSYDEILNYLDYIKSRYSDYVKVHLLGYSFEKRQIKAIEINWNCEHNLKLVAKENYNRYMLNTNKKISDNEITVTVPKQDRNMIFIEGGTHAREWLSISVALHCIYQLTERNTHNRDILRKLKFFIVPLVNPDGYEYARTTNPRWRKNRRPQNIDNNLIGVDCNRNFDFHWEKTQSRNRRNTYQGGKPFSEPETKVLGKALRGLSQKILFFLSLHSYATSIMYPWGYTRDGAENVETLEAIAQTGCKAIKSFNGRQYRVGSIASLNKRIIGGSVVDYVYGVIKVPIALVMELPSNEYGFQPPRQNISSLGHESWIGIKEMCRHAYSLKLLNSSNQIRSILEENTENSYAIEENLSKQDSDSVKKSAVI